MAELMANFYSFTRLMDNLYRVLPPSLSLDDRDGPKIRSDLEENRAEA